MDTDRYMHRCLLLAKAGAGHVAPNPMVGALLCYKDKIIGEGWHQQYGEAHAEVNAVRDAVEKGNARFLSHAVLYVSLEPCAHVGKTAPCTDLIIRHKIPKVVIGSPDPFKEVNGKGIEKLKAAGVEVELVSGDTATACRELNKRFFTYHTRQRPYIILKWAQTRNGKMANLPGDQSIHAFPSAMQQRPGSSRLLISNEYSNRLVHQWRSEEAAILVGPNTALYDDPELTNRHWPGASPLRIVIDRNGELPAHLKIFDRQVPTVIFNTNREETDGNLRYYRLKDEPSLIPQLVEALYGMQIQSVLVEGGAGLLRSFIEEKTWDEARVITNTELFIDNGLDAPLLYAVTKISEMSMLNDRIEIFLPNERNRGS